jgi:hypothetical protein
MRNKLDQDVERVLGINLGLWQSMFISILNMPSTIKILISVTACNSKINRLSLWHLSLGCNQVFLTHNTPVYLRTESSEREKRCGLNQKKNPWAQNCFIIHVASSVRIGASMRQLFWGDEQVVTFITRKYIDTQNNSHRITYWERNRLLILRSKITIVDAKIFFDQPSRGSVCFL